MQLKKILALALLLGLYQSQLTASDNSQRLEHEKAVNAALNSPTTQERDKKLHGIFVTMYFERFPKGTQAEADKLASLNIIFCQDVLTKDKAEKDALKKAEKALN
jgi:hypothetical protein